MTIFNPDTYCGIYCGACSIRIAGRTGRGDRLASFWSPGRIRNFLAFQKVPYNEKDLSLECGGCKSDRVFVNCRGCAMRKCAIEKQVEHCSDCDAYPCATYREWKNIQIMLPHLKETDGNLETIRRDGVQAWLAGQEKRWACPGCGTSFSWYTETCGTCGRDLRGSTYRFSRLKGFILKMGIHRGAQKAKRNNN
jgi:hypothetical protein